MRRVGLGVLLLSLCAAVAWASLYGTVTVADTAIGLTTIPPGTQYAKVCIEGASIRWRDDGTNPTDTVGMLLLPGQCDVFSGRDNLARFRMIRASGTSATAHWMLY